MNHSKTNKNFGISNKREAAYADIRKLVEIVSYLYSKAQTTRGQMQEHALKQLRKSYLELLRAIRICHRSDLIYTNVKAVEGLLNRYGLLNQQKNNGRRH